MALASTKIGIALYDDLADVEPVDHDVHSTSDHASAEHASDDDVSDKSKISRGGVRRRRDDSGAHDSFKRSQAGASSASSGRSQRKYLESSTPQDDENAYCAYFLSHKKVHSIAGAVPAQIAKNFHDSLELLGYRGWFDVDNLKEISKPALRRGIEVCQSMIILLNDETVESEWCRYEWDTALELSLPCKVIVDLERCVKQSRQQILDQMIASYPHLCSFQWVDFTEKYRRDALEELCEFLRTRG